MPDQHEAPYLDAVVAYVARHPGRFHIPGHKGIGADPGLIQAIGEAAVLHDVPAGIEGIDVGPEPTPFQRSQQLAADAWGAKRSWFLLNGASGGNHAICIALAHASGRLLTGPPDRGLVLAQRNVHSSIIDGMVLSGLRPAFVAPEIDPELGIAHCVMPEALDAALAAAPEAVAAILVSPTYFGAVSRIRELAEVAHARGVPLVVDEAWGSHLYFHDMLPPGALRGGADVVLSSTHKIVGSFTQSAILHLGEGGRVDEDLLDRSVTLVESTSPNALLTASIDAARRFAATRGQELLTETLETLERTRERIREIPGLDVLDERLAGATSVAAWDPLRLSIDVRGTGATGHRIAQLMRDRDDINLELFSENVIVAVFGLGEPAAEPAERLVMALARATADLGPSDLEKRRAFAEPPPWGPLELAPRDAYLGAQEVVPFDHAEGRIAAESLAAYPPGVPNVLPGERLTAPTLAYIADSLAHGGLVRGASDRSLRTIRVVKENPEEAAS
ncbi:MAG TPA: amino acid decarboxylase [Solirubrobacterales bacterium]|nr:amino acid decarboxylase [Solirubrobacterales bacterium]